MQGLFILLTIILVVAILTTICFVTPSMQKRKEVAKFSNYLYAHRGLHNDKIAENSMEAFENAVAHNYGFEFDVRLSKDDEVIVFHDNKLKRACGIDRLISEYTYQELEKFKLFGTNSGIPLFSEVLFMVSGKVPLIIELKSNDNWLKLCKKTAEILDKYEGDFCIESFDPMIVDWFKIHRPKYIRGLLMFAYKKGDYSMSRIDAFFTRNMFPNIVARPHFIAYDCKSRNKFGLKLMTKIYKLPEVSWTVKTQEKFNECINDNAIVIFEGFIPKTEV